MSESGVENSKNDETHVLNIGEGFDEIHKRWTKGHKSAARKARKARKEGVSVKLASSVDDWSAYYEVYEDSLKRWGEEASSVYGWKLFKEMFERRSSNIKLWLAICHGKIVAGSLCLYSKNHVVYWHGAAYSDYFKLRPVNLLMYEAIKHACEQGCSWFDFNPSGGHEGVKAFKRSFGAEAFLCPVVINELSLSKILELLQRKLRAL